MKRKDYKRPTMKVVKLQQQAHLLAGSANGSAGVQNYNVQDEQDW